MVTHFVRKLCVDIAFSNSSKAPDFLIFFTKLLTAFSAHFPSADESSFPFFHASRRLTTGGVNGNIVFGVVFFSNCIIYYVPIKWLAIFVLSPNN